MVFDHMWGGYDDRFGRTPTGSLVHERSGAAALLIEEEGGVSEGFGQQRGHEWAAWGSSTGPRRQHGGAKAMARAGPGGAGGA